MISLLKPYRPDPFKFRPPQIKRWLYWFFYCQNQFILSQSKIQNLHISTEDLYRLKQVSADTRMMIAANHICFVDPHVLLETAFRANLCFKWIAGIEPFDSVRGIAGWFIQSAGAFSIDRGVFDRRSLEYSQSVINEGRYPLVVYPEGEADYTNKVIQPFYAGLAQFAITAVEKHPDRRPVYIVPVGVSYQFKRSPQETLQKAIQNLSVQIGTACQQEGTVLTPTTIAPTAPLWEQLEALLAMSATYLENSYQVVPVASELLTERLANLREALLRTLLQEHLETVHYQDLPYEDLMNLKNRLRSTIARKCFAPPVEELKTAIQQAEDLLNLTQHTARDLKRLSRLENKWLGLAYPNLPFEKRMKSLLKHLRQQEPYALIRQQATPQDIIRWKTQMNDTRRIKMLTLLMGDLARQDVSWEGIDESLVKLEIMLFSQFIYRGPKQVFVKAGDPINVNAFMQDRIGLPQKQIQAELLDHVRQTITALVSHASPLQEKLTKGAFSI